MGSGMTTDKTRVVTYLGDVEARELEILRKIYARKRGGHVSMSYYLSVLVRNHLRGNRGLLDSFYGGIDKMVKGSMGDIVKRVR